MRLVARLTRRWVQFGLFGHVVFCILVAAIRQTLNR